MTNEMFIPSDFGKIAANVYGDRAKTEKLAIVTPGYLDSKDYPHIAGIAETLCGLGFFVVAFNPTGTWNSDGGIEQYSISQELSDIDNIVKYFNPKGDILLAGHSNGGFVSIYYASVRDNITTVVAVMPPPAPKKLATPEGLRECERTGFRISCRDIPGETGSEKEYRVPFEFAIDQRRYDAMKTMRDYHGKLLLIAGAKDRTVPSESVKKLFDAANEPKKFVVVEADHIYRESPSSICTVDNAIMDCLEE
jgi:pimeloyl-ACP methyl ester carboxylesterase